MHGDDDLRADAVGRGLGLRRVDRVKPADRDQRDVDALQRVRLRVGHGVAVVVQQALDLGGPVLVDLARRVRGGRGTVGLDQGGLVFGAVGQTEYIVRRMKEESGYTDAYVIATGGLGKIIAKETDCIDLYDPQLTLNGLRLIYERRKEN